MKQHSRIRSHSNLTSAFTIVELLVVIVVLAILVSITTVGFSEWRTRAAQTEVSADSAGVQAGMEDARNRLNGYPLLAIGTEFDGSGNTKSIFTQNKNVRIVYAGGDAAGYCLDIQSKATPSIRMFLNTANSNTTPKSGTCDGGETLTPPDSSQTTFVFNTAAPGCAGSVQLPVSQPTSSSGTINWGDGASQTLSSGLQSHTYGTAGTYVVTYDGPITQASYYNVDATKAKCLTKVTQWGNKATPTVVDFRSASNFVYVAEPPRTVTNMSNMFNGNTVFNQPIGSWDVSNVTNMNNMFINATAFNQALSNWNTSNVTNMNSMFWSASAFNQPIGNWNVSNVTNTGGMFGGTSRFNQSINSWNTSKLTSINHMFNQNTAFNQPLNSWDTSKVTDMYGAFYGASAFNQPLNSWNTSSATTMGSMFREAGAFNQPLSSWNTANVTDMLYMFNGAGAFNQPLNSWNTSNVTTMDNMFSNAVSFNQPLNNWNTAKVTNMQWMFNYTLSFNQNISGWNVGAVTVKTSFHSSSALTQANCPPSLW